MGKTVFGLLSEIYNGNFDKLPEKIKINGKIFIKSSIYNDYKKVDSDGSPSEWLVEYLSNEYDNIVDWLKLPVEEVEEGRWKPKKNEKFWIVNESGQVDWFLWSGDSSDDYAYKTNNCFKTEKEAKQHLNNIETEIELRQLAEELNDDEKIDWENENQSKYYLTYDYLENTIYQQWEDTNKTAKNIYCLDEKFKDKAIEEIGEEKLKKYLREK